MFESKGSITGNHRLTLALTSIQMKYLTDEMLYFLSFSLPKVGMLGFGFDTDFFV